MCVATVLTVYGIETYPNTLNLLRHCYNVATAPTAHGMRRRVRDTRGAARR